MRPAATGRQSQSAQGYWNRDTGPQHQATDQKRSHPRAPRAWQPFPRLATNGAATTPYEWAAKSGFSPEAIGSLEADQSGFLATRLTTKDGIAAPTSITITGDSCLVADLARNWMPPELTIGVVNNASLKIERGRPKVVLNSCPRPARPDVPSDEGDGACLAFAIVTPVGPDPPSRSKRMEAESLLAMYLEDEVIEGFPASGAEGGNYLAFVSGTYNSMLLSFDIQQQGLTAAQRDAVAAHGYTNPDHVSLLRFPTPALRIMAEEAGAYMCTLRDGRAFSVWMLTYEPHPRTVAALQSSPYFTGYGTQLTHPQLVTQQLTALLNRVRDTHTKVAQIAAQHATNEGKDILDAGNPSLWLLDYDGHAVDVLSNEFDMGLIGNYIYTKYFGRIVPISVVPRNQFKLTDVLVALANDPSKITFMLAAPAFLLPNPLHVYVPPLTISGTPYDIAIPPNLFDGMPSLQVLKGTMAASTSSAPNLQHPLASQLLAMSAATQTDWWRNLAGPALPSSLTDNRISHVRALLSEGCYRLVDMAGAPVPADPVPAAAVAAAAQDGINLLFEGV